MPRYLLNHTVTRGLLWAPARALHQLAAIGHLIQYGEGRSAASVRRFD